MPITPPSGLRARFASGWAYVSVPSQPGMSVEVEYSVHGAPFHPCAKGGADYLVPLYQAGTNIRTQWRARYTRGGQASEWTTGEAWAPDGFMEDAHAHPEPDPDPEPEPDPEPDPDPVPDEAPAAPRNVRAHCITHQSTKIEWDRDPAVHEYEVWLDGHRDAAQRTQDTIVTVTGLKPLTSYTAIVVAYSRSGKASAPGTVQFRTGSAEPAPDPDPDVDTAADWPAPDLMVWPLENGKVRASWVDPDDGQKPKGQMGYPYWHVSLDQKTWFFTRERQYEFEVAPGGEVFVSVYGVWDNTLTAIATKGVAL